MRERDRKNERLALPARAGFPIPAPNAHSTHIVCMHPHVHTALIPKHQSSYFLRNSSSSSSTSGSSNSNGGTGGGSSDSSSISNNSRCANLNRTNFVLLSTSVQLEVDPEGDLGGGCSRFVKPS